MPRLPQRQSLPTQTAEIILEMITSGELVGTLPGERSLATRLQIGRDTLRSSLGILESQGHISSREHGKRRTILKKAGGKTRSTTMKVAFLSPKKLRELPPWMLVEIDTLRELLNNRGFEFELLSPGIFHVANPTSRLDKLVKDNHFDVWILHQCPLAIQQWFQNKELPAIIRGFPHEGIEIPCIDEDWQASAFHAGGVLTRQGHRNIGLLMPDTQLAGLRATEAGLRQAVEGGSTNGTIHKLIENADPGSVCQALERAFRLKNPPTAIVGTRSRQILTVISWLAQHGLSIPKDLSYISLSCEPWFDHLTPSISHYHSDPATLARSVVRKIALLSGGGGKTSSPKLLIPEYHEGRSVQKLPS